MTIVQRVSRRSAVVLLALSPGLVMPAGAAEAPREVVVGPEYDASGVHRFRFGNGYRAEWTTPVTLEVLDLDDEAGGLSPLMQVGGMQTPGLAFKGADGRSYTFRSLDKEPQRILPPAWRDTAPARLFKDQTSASHPGAAPVFAALAEAAGILFPPTRLMVMPDVPALAHFRQTFAGKVGTFSEFPTPGFGGATEIVSSQELWSRWLEGHEGRVDGRVWFEGESSDKWHSAYGLGAMVQLIGTPLIFTGGVAKGDEGLGFYFKHGYSF